MNIAGGQDVLLVFARNPVVGQVKTRLIGVLGAQRATAVYLHLLESTLAVAATSHAYRAHVCIADDAPDSSLQQLLDRYGLRWSTQRGADLGTRMLHAIADHLQSASRAVLIGTDCPQFDPDYLQSAFAALATSDVVIGPAADGGYVLIGMRQAYSELFEGIPWGSDRVLELTRRRMSQLQLSWHELPTLHDVDTADDLAQFPHLARLGTAPD